MAHDPIYGSLFQMGPFFFLVRPRDNTAGVELVVGRLALYWGVIKGKPVFEWEWE